MAVRAARCVAVLVSASVVLAASGACRRATPVRSVIVTVDTARPGAALPDDFLGLSFEASVLGSARLAPPGSNLPALLRNLGVGHLRFGGNSLDRVAPWVPNPDEAAPWWAKGQVTPADLEHLSALSAATGWRADLGLTLGHPDAVAAADEASVAARLIGSGLGTAEIGNEPDLYAADKSLEPHGYSASDYRNEVAAYRAAMAASAPGVHLAGPDTAGVGGLAAFAGDEGPGLSFLTQHFYPLTRCGGRHPTIADLLSPATRQRETRLVDSAVAAARAAGLPVRIDETNSASCGGEDGVSNTLASALWMVDYLLLAGQRGVAGVDVHGGLAACRGYTVLCVPGAEGSAAEARPGIDRVADASLGAAVGTGPLSTQPVFYGLLLVRQLEGGRWLDVGSKPASPLREFALAMPDGSVRVVFDNPDPGFSARVVIRTGGRRAVTSVLRLTGPSLAATSGVRLGGAGVATDGSWSPVAEQERRAAAASVLDLGPATAAMVWLSPAET